VIDDPSIFKLIRKLKGDSLDEGAPDFCFYLLRERRVCGGSGKVHCLVAQAELLNRFAHYESIKGKLNS
jgi:hypothetical protein